MPILRFSKKFQMVTLFRNFLQTVPKVGRAKVPGAPVDCPTRIEQEKFQYSFDIRLRCEISQPDRHSLLVRRSILVHDGYFVFKDASLTRSRIASFTIATETLLPGYLDVYAIVLPSSDVPSNSGDGVRYLDSRNSAQDHHGGIVFQASSIESAANHLTMRQKGSGLVRGSRR